MDNNTTTPRFTTTAQVLVAIDALAANDEALMDRVWDHARFLRFQCGVTTLGSFIAALDALHDGLPMFS